MKNITALILLLLFASCGKNTQSKDLLTYQDYKNDQRIDEELEKSEDCAKQIALTQQFKTIDFLRKKATVFKNCTDSIINRDIEKADEYFIDRLELIFQADQKIRNQIDDSLGSNYTMEQLLYFVNKYEKRQDSISYKEFTVLVDSIGEWPGIDYVPRQPYYPKIEVLVAHFPEEGFVKYVEMAVDAAHQSKEFWSKAKLLIEYTMVKPDEKYLIEEQRFIIPFRFIRLKKNNAINEVDELTVLDFENLSNRQFFKTGCSNPKFHLYSSLTNLKDRTKLLNQAKKILIEQGVEEDRILLEFDKLESSLGYNLFFEEECV